MTTATPAFWSEPQPPVINEQDHSKLIASLLSNLHSVLEQKRVGGRIKFQVGRVQNIYLFLWVCKYNPLLQNLPKELVRVICGYLHFERELRKGDFVDILDTVQKWYPCYIKDVKVENGNRWVYIHYYGWDIKWDEWISLSSDRSDPLFLHSRIYGRTYAPHKVPECEQCKVMAPHMAGIPFWK